MGRERGDAWRQLPPFDRLYPELVARSKEALGPSRRRDGIPVSMWIKGTHVSLRIGAGRTAKRFQFRYRRSHRAWELFVHDGIRWIAVEPEGYTAGQLLEGAMLLMIREDGRTGRADGDDLSLL